jgi:hypothetical protein
VESAPPSPKTRTTSTSPAEAHSPAAGSSDRASSFAAAQIDWTGDQEACVPKSSIGGPSSGLLDGVD